MLRRDFRRCYSSTHIAHTLDPEDIGVHESGWTIEGRVYADYYKWVNEFRATHPELGFVRGDFEHIVYASSKAAYDHFFEHHPPTEWDSWDI